MKRLFTYLGIVLLAAGLATAQTTGDKAQAGGKTSKSQPPDPLAKTTNHKKGHKGGKKGSKNSPNVKTSGTEARPGMPPPTRPTDPK